MRSDRFEALDRLAPLFEAPDPMFDAFMRRRDRKRRNRRITAGIAGIAVLAAVVWAVSPGEGSDRTHTADDPVSTTDPADPTSTTVPLDPERVGFIGLPPEGAAASVPQTGELVASLWSHISMDAAWGTGEVYLYADGRLIWTRRDGQSIREGANEQSTGFLEQRLTPEGVELVRSEIIATGLFDADSPPPDDNALLRVGVQRGEGDWVVSVESELDREPRNALLRLGERLRSLESWLPASAWEDRSIRAYVPSRFAVDFEARTETGERLADPAAVLSLLPPSAREQLRGATGSAVDLPGPSGVDGAPDVFRFDLATQQARALVNALDDAGLERFGASYALGYHDPLLGPIQLAPYMPHGEPDCACTG